MGRKPASEYTPLRQLADTKYTLARVMSEIARACVRASYWRRARNMESEAKRLKQAEHLGEALAHVIIDPGDDGAVADLSTALAEYRLRWT